MLTTLKRIEPSSSPSPAEDWRFVDPDTLPADWPRYRTLVKRFLDRGEGCYRERDVLGYLLAGRWVLAASGTILPAAIVIIERVDLPLKSVLFVRYAAGNKDAILAGEEWLLEEARRAGCHAIETYARRGWERVLPDWKRARVVLRKDIE